LTYIKEVYGDKKWLKLKMLVNHLKKMKC
jgi:hypothetical protein